jgi:hypothetical protein
MGKEVVHMDQRDAAQIALLDLLSMTLAKWADICQMRTEELSAFNAADTKLLAELFRIRLDWRQGNLTEAQAKGELVQVLRGALV